MRRESPGKSLSGHQAEPVGRLPEGHGEPNCHQHEGRPLVLWFEAGQDVGANLQGEEQAGCLGNWCQ